ncbi:MAG TPA: hypothetical protein DEB18_04525 [Leeuwenhoekiella sp.]|nr:hypothetical protein [Leeuwenhoekiella sp.]
MSSAKKHIILINADQAAQANFLRFFSEKEVAISVFSSGMGAIQKMKQTDAPDLVVIEKDAKPLGAIQTLNYLREQLNYKGLAIITAVGGASDLVETTSQKVISMPINAKDVDSIKEMIQLKPTEVYHNIPVYSLDYLNDLSGGDQGFIQESIRLMENSVHEQLKELNKAYEKDDYDAVASIAHNIKPSFEMVMNIPCTTICNKLAHFDVKNEVPDLVKELNIQADLLLEALDSEVLEH